jgi:hypothetical protein
MTRSMVGSCLCGSVRFEITGDVQGFYLCHCTRCRKDTGSAHAANLFATAATIDWLSGRENVRTYRVPETRHRKSFCMTCGSAVPSVQSEGDLLMVPAGSLDSAIARRPDAHICLASRADWDERLEDITRLEGLPG